MNTLDALLAGIVADPLEGTRWLVLADYLEENDDPRRAELLRLHRIRPASHVPIVRCLVQVPWGTRSVRRDAVPLTRDVNSVCAAILTRSGQLWMMCHSDEAGRASESDPSIVVDQHRSRGRSIPVEPGSTFPGRRTLGTVIVGTVRPWSGPHSGTKSVAGDPAWR